MCERWTRKQAKQWYDGLPWLVGCNYIPRTAVNQLEMWQKETFTPRIIDQELRWASTLGMNSIRLFLHDLSWKANAKQFLLRLDRVLSLADKHGIGAMIVFFDSVWHPFPHAGPQREPELGVHNSGWVQSPGVAILRDEKKFAQLEPYVVEVIRHFRNDARVHAWDLWNEPDNSNRNSYGPRDLGAEKAGIVANYLPLVFEWARGANPTQPLTTGIWWGDWSSAKSLTPLERIQLELSDVVSFHCYGPSEDMEREIFRLQRYDRPLLCTEYMSRGSGSTFHGVMPILRKHRVAAYNWGLVAGRTQTNLPWDSWQHPYAAEPSLWFHDVFRKDGSPYSEKEVATIRILTGRSPRAAASSRSKGRSAIRE